MRQARPESGRPHHDRRHRNSVAISHHLVLARFNEGIKNRAADIPSICEMNSAAQEDHAFDRSSKPRSIGFCRFREEDEDATRKNVGLGEREDKLKDASAIDVDGDHSARQNCLTGRQFEGYRGLLSSKISSWESRNTLTAGPFTGLPGWDLVLSASGPDGRCFRIRSRALTEFILVGKLIKYHVTQGRYWASLIGG